MRIASERDPVGVKVTSVDGAIYTLLRIDYSTWSPPPTPDTVLSNWVDTNYYLTGYPYWPPEGTWIIKVQPATIESDWLEVDEDGNAVTTASGPLMGGSSAALAIASFDGGTGWDNVRFEVTLMRPAGIARACVRYQDNVNYLALAVESTQILLVKVVAGVQTVLGTSALAYPIDEYLQVQIDVLGDVLTVAIDGITVFEDVDAALSSGTLDTGTVALIAYGSATPSSFDDVVVTRLTGLGELAETLVEEPFTGSLPAGWTFANGSVPWAISSTPHNLLDLSLLQNVVLSLSYIFEMDL